MRNNNELILAQKPRFNCKVMNTQNRQDHCLSYRRSNAFYFLYLTDRDKKAVIIPSSFSLLDQDVITYIMYAPYPINLSNKATAVFYVDVNIVRTVVQFLINKHEPFYSVMKAEKWSIEDYDYPDFVVTPKQKMFQSILFFTALKNPEICKAILDPRIDIIEHKGTSSRMWTEVCCSSSVIKALSIPLQFVKGTSSFYKRQPVRDVILDLIQNMLHNMSINKSDLGMDEVAICYIRNDQLIHMHDSCYQKLNYFRKKFLHNECSAHSITMPQAQGPAEVFNTAKEVVTAAFEAVIKQINDLITSVCSIQPGKVMSWLREKFADLKEMFYLTFSDAVKYSLINTDKITLIIHGLCWAISIIMLGCAGFITWRTVNSMLALNKIDLTIPEAQGPQSVPWLIMAISSILGVTISEKSFSYQVITKILKVMAFGGTVLSAGAVILYMMPLCVRLFLIENFGTEQQKLGLRIEDWISSIARCQSLSYEVQVYRDVNFRNHILNLHKLGLELIFKSKHYSDLSKMVLPWFQRLTKIHKTVVMYESTRHKRDEPFGIHICAKPGVGKSLILEALVEDITGFSPKDIYTHSVGQEYTVGYMGEPIYVKDEFLVGDIQTKVQEIPAHLVLKSSAQCRPNFPSIDDPISGIKGTVIMPEVLITLNNTPYDRVDGFDDYAIQRRREVNLQLARKDSKGGIETGKARPIHDLSEDVIRNKEFILCRLLPPVHDPNYDDTPWISYYDAVEKIKAQYKEFLETADKVRGAFHLGPKPSLDIAKMVQDAIDGGYMSKPFNLFEGLSTLFSAQGSDVEETPQDCVSSLTTHVVDEEEDEELDEEVLEALRENGILDEVGRFIEDNDIAPQTILTRHFETLRSQSKKIDSYVRYAIKRNKEAIYTEEEKRIVKKGITNCPQSKVYLAENILRKIIENRCYSSMLEVFSELITHNTDESALEEVTSAEYSEFLMNKIIHSLSPYNRSCENMLSYIDLGGSETLLLNSKTLIIPGCIALGALLVGGVSLLMSSFNSKTPEVQSDPRKQQTTVRKKPQVLKPLKSKEVEAQGFFNDCITAIVSYGAYAIRVKMMCVGVRVYMTYSHWLRRPSIPVKITIDNSGNAIDWDWDSSKVLIDDTSDLLFINIDHKQLPQGKRIPHRFLREDQVSMISECSVYMTIDDNIHHTTVTREPSVKYLVSQDNSSITLENPLVYHANTRQGDCGIPIITSDGLYSNYIIGIHVAGYNGSFTNQAYGTPIFRETVESALEQFKDLPVSQGPDSDIASYFIGKEKDYPNLFYAQRNVRKIFLSTKTKIKKSIFYGKLESPTDKTPAILTSTDPRSHGKNPTIIALDTIFSAEKSSMNTEVLRQCFESLYYRLFQVLDYPVCRELTFEEAVKGIPELLSSLNSRTSPGYPLVTFTNVRKGKQDYVRYEGDEVIVDLAFKNMVLKRVKEMEEGREPDNYFLGALKDELRSQKKIDNVQTRITFANDLISLVAFRMKFGGLLISLNRSFKQTGFAIGINQYSRDMDMVHKVLSFNEPTEYFDGDFAGYDLSLPTQLLEAAYQLIGRLLIEKFGIDQNSVNYFIKHETNGKVMMGDFIFRSIMNYSGCFLTTIINCICLNLGFRYVFKTDFPFLDFDDFIKLVILGDDHLTSKLKSFEWTPAQIAEGFLRIGMKYTCADKSAIEDSTFKEFSEVTFLGAVPIHFSEIDDTYVGRSKLSSLLDSLQFTRNLNTTIKEEAVSKLELLSMYPKEFYERKRDLILKVAKDEGIAIEWLITQAELKMKVSMRNIYQQPIAQSGGPVIKNIMSNLRPLDTSTDLPSLQAPVQGLTTLTSNNPKPASDYEPSAVPNNAARAINEQAMDLGFGLESMIKRTTVTWNTTDNQGDTLISIPLPWGLLALGNINNIQNMPFNNFIYFVGDIELTFQVNGVPTQAGLLTAYHLPLHNSVAYYDEWTTFNHVLLTPADNACKKLLIPFKFWRTAMNTYAGPMGEESLGKLNLGVTVPLSSLAASSCSITIFSRFVNAKFSIPRPLAQGADEHPLLPMAQGNTTSNISYNIGSVAGSVPIENKVDASHSVSASASIPLDNPPLTGCSVPIAGVYPSMSKNKGLEPTVSLQHHPEMLNREAHMLTDPMVSDINNILSRRFLVVSSTWTSALAAGASIYEIPLNSMCISDAAYNFDSPVSLGFAILSQFARWRADIVFEIYVNRTAFHSGRLLATTAYGSPGIAAGTENIYYNEVLDYNGDNYWNTVKVVYNASTEFLRTYEGPGAVEKVLDHSLGQFKLSVLNPLKITSAIVPDSVSVRTFVHFENVRVYELKLNPIAQITSDYPNGTLTSQGSNDVLVAQADNAMAAENTVDPDLGTGAPTTEEETKLVSKTPYSLEVGRKYEYTISNLLEVVRRHYEISFAQSAVGTPLYPTAPPASPSAMLWKIEVRPHHRFSQLFAGWSGHLKYRIIIKTDLPVYYTYVCNNKGNATDLDGGLLAKGYYSSSNVLGTNPQRVITTNGTANNNNIPWEVAYPTSSSQAMIDVSIPFNSHLNYLPTIPGDTFGADPSMTASNFNFSNGYLGILIQETASNIKVFEAAGDDFRYHLWRPINGARLRPYRGSGTPALGDVVGDNRF